MQCPKNQLQVEITDLKQNAKLKRIRRQDSLEGESLLCKKNKRY